jgi:hypothetical protein
MATWFGVPQPLVGIPEPAYELRYLWCGERLLAVWHDSYERVLRLWCWTEPAAPPRELATFTARIAEVATSHDQIAVLLDLEDGITPPRLVLFDLEGNATEVANDFRFAGGSPGWSADGERLAVPIAGGTLVLDNRGRYLDVIPQPGGVWIHEDVVVGHEPSIQRWRPGATGGTPLEGPVAVSPDARFVITLFEDAPVVIDQTGTRRALPAEIDPSCASFWAGHYLHYVVDDQELDEYVPYLLDLETLEVHHPSEVVPGIERYAPAGRTALVRHDGVLSVATAHALSPVRASLRHTDPGPLAAARVAEHVAREREYARAAPHLRAAKAAELAADWRACREHLEHAFRHDPTQPYVYESLVNLLESDADWPRLLEVANQLVELLPRSKIGYVARGHALLRLGRCGEALADLDAARQHDRDDYRIALRRAEVLAGTGRSSEALDALAEAYELGGREAAEANPAFSSLRADPELASRRERLRDALDREAEDAEYGDEYGEHDET